MDGPLEFMECLGCSVARSSPGGEGRCAAAAFMNMAMAVIPDPSGPAMLLMEDREIPILALEAASSHPISVMIERVSRREPAGMRRRQRPVPATPAGVE